MKQQQNTEQKTTEHSGDHQKHLKQHEDKYPISPNPQEESEPEDQQQPNPQQENDMDKSNLHEESEDQEESK